MLSEPVTIPSQCRRQDTSPTAVEVLSILGFWESLDQPQDRVPADSGPEDVGRPGTGAAGQGEADLGQC
ncbi:hypothetical protein K6168_10175 [Streptomyces sp. FB2]|uniref:hypothetical protein n=1 Tax=Streptomyces sp. FB2 TaxID=2902454 RepID=UPI001F391052|nr:hypothetical protein [Streptomyces sp. FB2]MCF2536026.1 hypothetical protein [Streptomyces sp. FB2]